VNPRTPAFIVEKETHMRRRLVVIPILLIGTALTMASDSGHPEELQYTADFGLDPGQLFVSDESFLPDGGNPYFSLRPGTFRRFEGEDEGQFVEVEVTVLGKVRPVAFELDGRWMTAITRVVEEREWINGQLAEVTWNYYARRPGSGDIFYFGEDVEIYSNGQVVSQEGSWLAGRDGAKPGLYMPDLFLLGSRYFQEMAPGVSMDRAEHVDMGVTVETPAGVFEGCVVVMETTALEEDEETVKVYAPGLGLVVDGSLQLAGYH
jgi:hypothetical protein